MKNLEKYGYFIFAVFVIFMFVKPAICFLILGFYMLYLGSEYKVIIDEIEQNGITTEGKIIKYSRDDEGYQIPIINFSTKKGEFIEKEPHYYFVTDFNKFKSFKNSIGESTIIKYNAKKPEQFVIDGKYSLHRTTIIIMILVSLILITIGTLSIFGIIKMNV